MRYTLTSPCSECPFLQSMAHGFSEGRLEEFASGAFPCHKTAETNGEGDFEATEASLHCAGALIYLERRGRSNQMMRVMERLGLYDASKLNMAAPVR